jgi:hypothetical protein
VSGSTLQAHTLPNPTPIPTVFLHTAEHDSQYPNSIQKNVPAIMFDLYAIRAEACA